ncbi:hypothetical protein L596_012449 [Steinernema carpocapsae]|uniref:Uncharacterized protein n=1 Tax=Steinernema carpocapsae TaxID=34508 RepID=A0A4U5NXY4_STECR|nr:hypothetical protein L596_012449 [Steinernema carpocapsae]
MGFIWQQSPFIAIGKEEKKEDGNKESRMSYRISAEGAKNNAECLRASTTCRRSFLTVFWQKRRRGEDCAQKDRRQPKEKSGSSRRGRGKQSLSWKWSAREGRSVVIGLGEDKRAWKAVNRTEFNIVF